MVERDTTTQGNCDLQRFVYQGSGDGNSDTRLHLSLSESVGQTGRTHDFKRQTVRHCLHNIMSPLSAMSGYIELLNASIDGGMDQQKVERYSQKIAAGLQEIGFLLEQLQEMHRMDSSVMGPADLPEVDLNWLVRQITELINTTCSFTASDVNCNTAEKPVHIRADLFQVKLMIYNLINSIDQFATEETEILIETSRKQNQAVLTIRCTGETVNNEPMERAFDLSRKKPEQIPTDSPLLSGLAVSHQISRQIDGAIELDAGEDRTQVEFRAPLAASEFQPQPGDRSAPWQS